MLNRKRDSLAEEFGHQLQRSREYLSNEHSNVSEKGFQRDMEVEKEAADAGLVPNNTNDAQSESAPESMEQE